jgi:nucleotidyltransferase-like protein
VARRDEVDRVTSVFRSWARGRPDVHALALVGSWARGSAAPTSDVDLICLTGDIRLYTVGSEWMTGLDAVELVHTRGWGVLTELRLRMPAGLEVDLGIASSTWAAIDPVDLGTVRVVRDGLVPLHDPNRRLAELVAAVARAPA